MNGFSCTPAPTPSSYRAPSSALRTPHSALRCYAAEAEAEAEGALPLTLLLYSTTTMWYCATLLFRCIAAEEERVSGRGPIRGSGSSSSAALANAGRADQRDRGGEAI